MTMKPPAAFDLLLPRTFEGESVQLDAGSEVLRLFDECGPGLRRYIAAFGLGAEASDDVLQEAFLSLFRHLCLDRSRRNLKGWLFRVAHNLALKQRQRNVRAQQSGVVADAIADPADNPEQQVAGQQRRQRLRAVVRALPERDRHCLYLRAEGLPYRDIAETLGISLGSVAKSIARAVARLTRADLG